jgi:hypothetical protein
VGHMYHALLPLSPTYHLDNQSGARASVGWT